MNPRLKALLDKKQSLITESAALQAKADWSAEDEARAEAIPGEIAALDASIDRLRAFGAATDAANAALNGAGGLQSLVGGLSNAGTEASDMAATAVARYRGKVRNWKGATAAEATRKAYRFGMWALATMGNARAISYCSQNGLPVVMDRSGNAINAALGQSEGINEDGGFLVPTEFESDLIDLREQYGLFRQLARTVPMGSDTKIRRRRRSGLTAYFVGEAQAALASKKGWDSVSLTAKKVMVLAYYTAELDEDSVISMGDDLAQEVAYAFARLEDDCGFNGDGSSAYGKIMGVRTRLLDVYGAGGGKGLVLASGNQWAEITLGDFTNVKGALPQYADTPNAGWHCHKTFYHDVMEKIMLSSGGVTAAEVAQGRRQPLFMGYPVHISQILPNAEANSQIPVLFGDLRLAADFGDRRQTTLRFSTEAAFETDEIAAKGTERFDINVHDVGSATEAGPIVGLITANS